MVEESATVQWPVVMGTETAHVYLAPSISTLSGWARPSWRDRNAATVRRMRIQKPYRSEGLRRVGWARAALDRWLEQLHAKAEPESLRRTGRQP